MNTQTIQTPVTVEELELVIQSGESITRVGNGKTIKDLEKEFQSEVSDTKVFFLCNEKDTYKINSKVQLIWDDFNGCLGIYIEDAESFVNLPTVDEDFASFYNTNEGKDLMLKVFNSLTSLAEDVEKAIELLDKADLNNPDILEIQESNKELRKMGVIDEDDCIINNDQNKQLYNWWELNRC